MVMRPSALERSKPPWPPWPALDRRCPCRDAAVLLLPSAHLRRTAPSVVGACLRERKEAFFPPAHQNQERKKQSRSVYGVQALCSQSWLCAQAVCVSFWCLSGVLLGVNGCTQSLSVFLVPCSHDSPAPRCLVPHLGIHLSAIASPDSGSRLVQTRSRLQTHPHSRHPILGRGPPSATSKCPQATASVHD